MRKIIGYVIGFCIGFIIISAFFGFITMGFWNYLMPKLFGLSKITFFQGLMLFYFVKMLVTDFKNVRFSDSEPPDDGWR